MTEWLPTTPPFFSLLRLAFGQTEEGGWGVVSVLGS
jgi:hypothetical protein